MQVKANHKYPESEKAYGWIEAPGERELQNDAALVRAVEASANKKKEWNNARWDNY